MTNWTLYEARIVYMKSGFYSPCSNDPQPPGWYLICEFSNPMEYNKLMVEMLETVKV